MHTSIESFVPSSRTESRFEFARKYGSGYSSSSELSSSWSCLKDEVSEEIYKILTMPSQELACLLASAMKAEKHYAASRGVQQSMAGSTDKATNESTNDAKQMEDFLRGNHPRSETAVGQTTPDEEGMLARDMVKVHNDEDTVSIMPEHPHNDCWGITDRLLDEKTGCAPLSVSDYSDESDEQAEDHAADKADLEADAVSPTPRPFDPDISRDVKGAHMAVATA